MPRRVSKLVPLPTYGAETWREAREGLGLTREELAHIIGCHESTITRYENGHRQPDVTACRIMDWLMEGWRPPEWPARLQRPVTLKAV